MTGTPVRVGLVGAGPWAHAMHAPTLAAGPETTLTAVYARRQVAAADLADRYGATATDDFAELLARCEAVAFAVRPDIQAELATVAARAGKALLLDKPIALDVPAARLLAGAVAEHHVVTQVVLTKRYHPITRQFLAAAGTFPVLGARSRYLHGGFLGGDQASPWRLTYGPLPDLGPHLLDLLEAALGPVTRVAATGDPARWVQLSLAHESGATSEASLSGSVRLDRATTTVDLYGERGLLSYDTATIDHAECWPIMRAEFAQAVRSGMPHELDVCLGLRLQELVDAAQRALATGHAVPC